MVTYLPISSPFIRFAGRYVDEAFGVAAGYNFFIFEAALVPFEIVACNVIIHYCKCISSQVIQTNQNTIIRSSSAEILGTYLEPQLFNVQRLNLQ